MNNTRSKDMVTARHYDVPTTHEDRRQMLQHMQNNRKDLSTTLRCTGNVTSEAGWCRHGTADRWGLCKAAPCDAPLHAPRCSGACSHITLCQQDGHAHSPITFSTHGPHSLVIFHNPKPKQQYPAEPHNIVWSKVSCAHGSRIHSHCTRPPMPQQGHIPEEIERGHNDCKEAGIGLRAAQAHRPWSNPLCDCSAAVEAL